MTTKGDHLLVAAIDFGTTYSGYAYSWRHEFQADPLKMHANQAWNSGGGTHLSLKTPTCLLLNANKEFDSFGYEAENRYADMEKNERDNYYYFHRFKMVLHNNTNITSDMMLEDIAGKSLPAIDVFALSIKELATHLTNRLLKQATIVTKSDIQWVLTVPSIWSDAAKQLMRKSAVKVSGTADIIVHDKLVNSQLKELCRATGNDCGGTSVDNSFYEMLEEIFGISVLQKMKHDDPSTYLDLFREFEIVKRTITPTKDSNVKIKIPYSTLDEKCDNVLKKNLPNVIKSSIFSEQIIAGGDKIRVDASLLKSLFKSAIDSIISLIQEILKTKAASGVSQMLLVGGFAECMLVQDAITKNFKDKTVIIPQDAELSVLKGAVLYGHRSEYVQSRIMQCSYGLELRVNFDPKIHDEKHLDDRSIPHQCTKIFDIIVEKDQKVELGQKFEKRCATSLPMQDALTFQMYTSTNRTPMYTDERSCTHLGSARITFPTPSKDIRKVRAEYIFGNTEISMTAVDVTTGTTIAASF